MSKSHNGHRPLKKVLDAVEKACSHDRQVQARRLLALELETDALSERAAKVTREWSGMSAREQRSSLLSLAARAQALSTSCLSAGYPQAAEKFRRDAQRTLDTVRELDIRAESRAGDGAN